MPQGDQGGLPSGQGGAEGNAEILFGESAVAGQNRPDQQPDCLTQHETESDGKQPDQGHQRKSKKIEQTIHEKNRR